MTSTSLQPREASDDSSFGEWGGQALVGLEEAGVALDLEPWIVDRLRHPEEESTSYLQLIGDSGDAACVPLFHVEHSAGWEAQIGSLSLLPDLQTRTCQMIGHGTHLAERSAPACPSVEPPMVWYAIPDELSERELARVLMLAAHSLAGAGRTAIADGSRTRLPARSSWPGLGRRRAEGTGSQSPASRSAWEAWI